MVMMVIGLVLGQSLMVVCNTGVLLYAKVCPLYNVNNIVYKHFDRSLHDESLDPTCDKILDLYLLQFLRYWDSN